MSGFLFLWHAKDFGLSANRYLFPFIWVGPCRISSHTMDLL